MNYYNEIDPFAAKWLRELIKAGHISPGEVDERSIEDVKPNDLSGFRQCHFFAGVGVWSYALRQAGWHDDRPVWTGSCPCQPFSAAGKRGGTSDERHLWPALFHHISELRPLVFFGEQVASKDGLAWFDTVSNDLEAASYTVGSADLCAAGFGAPHIRQRLYFVGEYMDHAAAKRLSVRSGEAVSGSSTCGVNQRSSDVSGLAHPFSNERRQERENGGRICEGSGAQRLEQRSMHGSFRDSELGNPEGSDREVSVLERGSQQKESQSGGASGLSYWSSCDWLPCIDGKTRPVEPGTFPLAHGVANRVGRLRGYGNALCAPVAQGFIEAYLESEG